MNIIDRVKNILLTPKTEWEVINGETATPISLLTSYVLPLAVVGSLGGILGFFVFGGLAGAAFAIGTAIIGLVVTAIAFVISSHIVDALAPSFESEKNLTKSAQLVAYSSTATAVAGLLSFIPIIGWLIALAGWGYGAYLMYLGIGSLKKTKEDKKIIYVIVIYVIWIAIFFILLAILGAILLSLFGGLAMISR